MLVDHRDKYNTASNGSPLPPLPVYYYNSFLMGRVTSISRTADTFYAWRMSDWRSSFIEKNPT